MRAIYRPHRRLYARKGNRTAQTDIDDGLGLHARGRAVLICTSQIVEDLNSLRVSQVYREGWQFLVATSKNGMALRGERVTGACS
eukprot:946336-Pleurochrysis_carterae.AAC.1